LVNDFLTSEILREVNILTPLPYTSGNGEQAFFVEEAESVPEPI
jgi:hypothetical protein